MDTNLTTGNSKDIANDSSDEDRSGDNKTSDVVDSLQFELAELRASPKAPSDLYVVAFGASAGGLETFKTIIENLEKCTDRNIAYILAQHLSPNHRSMLTEILSRSSKLNVLEIQNGDKLEVNTVYVTPENKDLTLDGDVMILDEPTNLIGPKPNIDRFFTSLADNFATRAVAVVLSGTGSDGMHGIKAVKAKGGITIAQKPDTAKYDSMPRNSIDSGNIDFILSASEITYEIYNIIKTPGDLEQQFKLYKNTNELKELLSLLLNKSGVDFSHYKNGTLFRRINRRITACNCLSLSQYLNYIQSNPDELDKLYKDILISVTKFFRDTDAFLVLQQEVSKLIQQKKRNNDNTIRVWVPACATGEEAYSIVILFAKTVGGINQLKSNYNFQIYATDIDTDALNISRKGLYPSTTIENLSDEDLKTYFQFRDNHYEINRTLREMVVFSKHNVFQNPPFSRLDLISCRNLLIYFDNNLQNKVLEIFNYALKKEGLLFIGKSEGINKSIDLFKLVNPKARIFKLKDKFYQNTSFYQGRSNYNVETKTKVLARQITHDLPDAIVSAFAPNSVLIDNELKVIRIYGNVSDFTTLPSGSLTNNIVDLVNKEIKQELRANVHLVIKDKINQISFKKYIKSSNKAINTLITLYRITIKKSNDSLILVSFKEDTNTIAEPAKISDHNSDIISDLENELSMTKEYLQTVIEELETTNEELQSTNEELQSSNEELQSSNEELQTSNEELQSTNEELQTVNDELNNKSIELSILNSQLNTIKENIPIAIISLDDKGYIINSNSKADEFFEMEYSNTSKQKLANSYPKVEIPEFFNNLRKVYDDKNIIDNYQQLNDKHYLLNFIRVNDEETVCKYVIITIHDNSEKYLALNQLADKRRQLDLIIESSNIGLWEWDIQTNQMFWSSEFMKLLGYKDSDYKEQDFSFYDFKKRIHPSCRNDVIDIFDAHLERNFDCNLELQMCNADGEYIWLKVSAVAYTEDKTKKLIGSAININEQKLTIKKLIESNSYLEQIAYVCSHDLKEPVRVIGSYAKLLAEEYQDKLDESANKYLEFLNSNSLKIKNKIDNILRYSQFENSKYEFTKIDVKDIVDDVLAELKSLSLENKVKINTNNLPVLNADKIQLRQLFYNLILNAITHNIGNKDLVIEIDVKERNEDWLFTIKDNGIGIRNEHLDKIFELFCIINPKVGINSTGIGLSICKKAALNHHGDIWVESEYGNYTIFNFTISKNLAG